MAAIVEELRATRSYAAPQLDEQPHGLRTGAHEPHGLRTGAHEISTHRRGAYYRVTAFVSRLRSSTSKNTVGLKRATYLPPIAARRQSETPIIIAAWPDGWTERTHFLHLRDPRDSDRNRTDNGHVVFSEQSTSGNADVRKYGGASGRPRTIHAFLDRYPPRAPMYISPTQSRSKLAVFLSPFSSAKGVQELSFFYLGHIYIPECAAVVVRYKKLCDVISAMRREELPAFGCCLSRKKGTRSVVDVTYRHLASIMK